MAQQHDIIVNLKSQMQILEERLQQSDSAVMFKSELIQTLQRDLSRLKVSSFITLNNYFYSTVWLNLKI